MRNHGDVRFDITNAYFKASGSISLFSGEEETENFKIFEAHSAKIIEVLESIPETRKIIREDIRIFSTDVEALTAHFGEEKMSSREGKQTIESKITMLLSNMDRVDAELDAALESGDESEISARRKAKYDMLVDSDLGTPFLNLALEHPTAGRARLAKARLDAVRNKIVEANMRLVSHLAKRYRTGSLSMMDFVQEGSFGLMRAIQRFDWRRGFKFSTYATWWIKQSISRAISEKESDIRVPVHHHETIRRVQREATKFQSLNGRAATTDDLDSFLGINKRIYESALNAMQKTLQGDHPHFWSDSETPLFSLIADENVPAADDIHHFKQSAKLVEELLVSCLEPRERNVIMLRFGLQGDDPKTLEDVGKVMGVTRERIRQIEKAALGKLKKAHNRGKIPFGLI